MNATIWTDQERDLWARIVGHEFEPEGQAMTFTGRLARDHRWSVEYARGAIEEYRRFCFLAATASGPMTPSEDIDEVWHQHLTFSHDYWDRWCGQALRKALHHQPTQGGLAEGRRFAEQYARTLARYEAYFGTADVTYWPGTARRFGRGPRFRIVDLDRTIVMPIPAAFGRWVRRIAGMVGLVGFVIFITSKPAAAVTLGVLDWTAWPFIQLYIATALAALGAAFAFDGWTRQRASKQGRAGKLSSIELALLSGGESRAADVLALKLLQAGRLAVAHDRALLVDVNVAGEVPPQLARLIEHGPKLARARLGELMRPWIEPGRERLARQGLALSRSDVARIRGVTASLVLPVIVLGLAKIAVGLSRDKPVGFLIILVAATAIAGALIARAGRLATAAGADVLLGYEKRHPRALRAPLPEEAIMAFAIVGATALAGTPLAAYAEVIGNGGHNGGGGCGGGGCGGGGGGGCGGCGGG